MKKLLFLLLTSLSCFAITPEQCGYPGFPSAAQVYIQKALDSTGFCELEPHTYPCTGTIYMYDGYTIRGYGNSSAVGTLYDIILFDVKGNNTTFEKFKAYGNGGATGGTGIRIQGSQTLDTTYYNCKIHNVLFDQFNSYGVLVKWNTSNFLGSASLLECTARGCVVGYGFEERGEYVKMTSCNANLCGTAILNRGGNNMVIGGQFNYNTVAFKLAYGTNDGHCHADGLTINHNDIAILADSLQYGYVFSNCSIHIGDIDIIDSHNIYFKDNRVQVDSITVVNSLNCNWEGNAFMAGPAISGVTISATLNKFE